MTERKYTLTKLGAGDYILPANDGLTLWRITRYEEDGSAEVSPDGKEWHSLRGQFWMTWKYKRAVKLGDSLWTEWDAWESWQSGLPTRAAAIEAALR